MNSHLLRNSTKHCACILWCKDLGLQLLLAGPEEIWKFTKSFYFNTSIKQLMSQFKFSSLPFTYPVEMNFEYWNSQNYCFILSLDSGSSQSCLWLVNIWKIFTTHQNLNFFTSKAWAFVREFCSCQLQLLRLQQIP